MHVLNIPTQDLRSESGEVVRVAAQQTFDNLGRSHLWSAVASSASDLLKEQPVGPVDPPGI